jgi:hypothetical protein
MLKVRKAISEEELNTKVMTALHLRTACVDARSVMLELVESPAEQCNWRIGHFDPGRGDRYACKVALRSIHASLQDDYDMVGYS